MQTVNVSKSGHTDTFTVSVTIGGIKKLELNCFDSALDFDGNKLFFGDKVTLIDNSGIFNRGTILAILPGPIRRKILVVAIELKDRDRYSCVSEGRVKKEAL